MTQQELTSPQPADTEQPQHSHTTTATGPGDDTDDTQRRNHDDILDDIFARVINWPLTAPTGARK
eukprot:gene58-19863_t